MAMDRKHCSPLRIPPGFGGKLLNGFSSASSPVNIPLPLTMNSTPSRNMRNSPAIAASAPSETIPYVEMLLNSSSERRSLSPLRKIANLHNERVRVLSCSDLESTLTSRSYKNSKLQKDFPPPPPIPIFHHLPPTRASSRPQFVQQQAHRMPIGSLILGQRAPGQLINRTIQPVVRPPPGFEVSPLNTPSSPLTPPQFPSPQPWSPARLAHRTRTVETKIKRNVSKNPGGAIVQYTSTPHDGGRSNKDIQHLCNACRSLGRRPKIGGQSCLGECWIEDSMMNRMDESLPFIRISTPPSLSPLLRLNEEMQDSKKNEWRLVENKKKKRQKKNNINSKNNNIEKIKETQPSKDVFPNMKLDWSIDKSDAADIRLYSIKERHGFPDSFLKELKLWSHSRKWTYVEEFEPYLSLEEVESGVADKTLIESAIRINHKNCEEAYVSDWDNGGQDIVIVGSKDRNRSLDGDIVVVKVKEESNWGRVKRGGKYVTHKSGKVVFIKERVHHRNAVGSLHKIEGVFVLMPRDSRFPYLQIQKESIPTNIIMAMNSFDVGNLLFKASMTSWVNLYYAEGILKKKIGKRENISCETAAILEELGIDSKPVPHFKKLVPPLPYIIPEEELTSRLDLRSEVTFSIDPPSAKDLDDAVSIKKLNEDTFKVGVHISDVTYFLKEGTKLDKMVSNRATTIYMVEEVFHMLPLTLCELCSLSPGQDKLTISVIMTVSKDGVVMETEFRRSVIHSCCQLTYDQVQDVIDDKVADFPEIFNNVKVPAIKEAILQLHELARVIRTKRFETGALKIDQPKVHFSLDQDNMPIDCTVYEIKDSNRLIEEFMLLANQSVAKFIYEKAPDIALLRKHDPPKQDMISRLENNLNEIGIFLDTSSAGSLHSSLLKYCEDDENKAHVLYHLCAKPMQRANYFCSSRDTRHYALNMDLYTHFTSPIRRYADVIVHRILTSCLGLTEMPAWDAEKINKFASVCNKKKYSAKRANELSCDLYRIFYVKKVGSLTVKAIVLSVTPFSLYIIVPSLDLVTRISLSELKPAKFKVVDKNMDSAVTIKWPEVTESQELKIFSSVEVHLTYKMRKYNKNMDKITKPEIIATLLPPANSSR